MEKNELKELEKICYDVGLIHNALHTLSRSAEQSANWIRLDQNHFHEIAFALELIAGHAERASDSLWDYFYTESTHSTHIQQ